MALKVNVCFRSVKNTLASVLILLRIPADGATEVERLDFTRLNFLVLLTVDQCISNQRDPFMMATVVPL